MVEVGLVFGNLVPGTTQTGGVAFSAVFLVRVVPESGRTGTPLVEDTVVSDTGRTVVGVPCAFGASVEAGRADLGPVFEGFGRTGTPGEKSVGGSSVAGGADIGCPVTGVAFTDARFIEIFI